jgi:hypothetical protein
MTVTFRLQIPPVDKMVLISTFRGIVRLGY